jgi:hypothetical protein
MAKIPAMSRMLSSRMLMELVRRGAASAWSMATVYGA